jgi:thiol-disulfide isomerase/thioredoxin
MTPHVQRLLVPLVLLVACARPQPRTATLSLHDIDCADCAEDIRQEAEKSGTKVYDAKFDKRRAVLTLQVDPSVTDEQLINAAKRKGIRATPDNKGGSYLPDAKAPEGFDVAVVVSDGSDYPDLQKALVPGKITVVDFYADWCMPCRKVDEHVKKLSNVAYRRFNVVDWDTPLAKRYLNNIPELPYVIVFNASGARVDAVSGADLLKLDAAIAKAK